MLKKNIIKMAGLAVISFTITYTLTILYMKHRNKIEGYPVYLRGNAIALPGPKEI